MHCKLEGKGKKKYCVSTEANQPIATGTTLQSRLTLDTTTIIY